jgi:predicted Fe-Mo cluster-binding NifX family protein
MKIAVITDDGKTISRHFGRAPYYLIFSVENGTITQKTLVEKLGHNHFHSADASGNHEHGPGHGMDAASHDRHAGMANPILDCNALICGGMGMGAYQSMRMLNIQPIVTELSDPDLAVKQYLDGNLVDRTEMLH